VTEASIRLSIDTDFIGKLETTPGQSIMRLFVFLLQENCDGKETSLVSVPFALSSLTHAKSIS